MYKLTFYLRHILKFIFLLTDLVLSRHKKDQILLTYHSVGENILLELDVAEVVFRQQVGFLSTRGRFIAFDQFLENKSAGVHLGEQKYVLTFDDGYQNFKSRVLPILKEKGIPAILFVCTGYIENPAKLPIARHINFDGEIKALSWGDLVEISREPLITIGSHSHSHADFDKLSNSEIRQDIEKSQALFQKHLGFTPEHFCYPRGAYNSGVRDLISEYFVSAVTAEFDGLETKQSDSNFELKRLSVLKSDGFFWFRLRVLGWLHRDLKFLRGVSGLLRKLA